MLAYSSIASTVYVSNTSSEMEETVALDFAANVRGSRNAAYRAQFGVRRLTPLLPYLLSILRTSKLGISY